MNTSVPQILFALMALVTCNPQLSTAFAQGNAFTYQGRFTDNGSAYTGNAEFQFTLWDAATGGNQMATTNPEDTLAAVTNGLFTVSLDFGSAAFDGADRWLEIKARTSIGVFTLLTPRQAVTASPYAMFALSGNEGPPGPVGPAGPQGPPGTTGASPFWLDDTNAFYLDGFVGIGKSDPATALDVNGTVSAANFLGNGAGLSGLNGSAITGGTITSAQLASGSVGATQLAPGASLANLAASGQSGVAS
jgi:hypothetical protein